MKCYPTQHSRTHRGGAAVGEGKDRPLGVYAGAVGEEAAVADAEVVDAANAEVAVDDADGGVIAHGVAALRVAGAEAEQVTVAVVAREAVHLVAEAADVIVLLHLEAPADGADDFARAAGEEGAGQ